MNMGTFYFGENTVTFVLSLLEVFMELIKFHLSPAFVLSGYYKHGMWVVLSVWRILPTHVMINAIYEQGGTYLVYIFPNWDFMGKPIIYVMRTQ